MTLPQLPATTLDQVFTRYAFNVIGSKEYKDQHYKRRPILKALDEQSLPGDGGANIMHRVNLGTSANGGSLGRNGTFTISGDANETWSRYQWRVVYETCFVSWWDIREAGRNKQKVVSILRSRINETRENLEDTLVTMLCASAAASSDDVSPILSIVATSGASGGLDPANSGQEDWAAETEATIDWGVEGVGRTRELFNRIEDNKGNPDLLLLPDSAFNETCETADSALVLNQDVRTRGGTKYADLGTKVPLIMNTPVMRDPAWNSAQPNTGVALDLADIHLVTDPTYDMYMYPFKEMAHHGRFGQASVQVKVCELTCSRRRTQGLLSSIS